MNAQPNRGRLILLVLVLTTFLAFTAWAFIRPGLLDLCFDMLANPVGAQVGIDLAICMVLLLTFIWPDARRRGIPPLPYAVACIICGSPMALVYFIHREFRPIRTA